MHTVDISGRDEKSFCLVSLEATGGVKRDVVVVVVDVPQRSIRWNSTASIKFTTATGAGHRSSSDVMQYCERCELNVGQCKSKCSVVCLESGHVGQYGG